MFKPAFLVLADGQVFEGRSVGAEGTRVGELVFNTAMTGYQEILTDPSYTDQIVMLTAAHIGNTGWNDEDMESSRAWASGLVVRDCTLEPSNYRSQIGLSDWLKHHEVPAIAGIDTRQLTLYLRDQGAVSACITTDAENIEDAIKQARHFKGVVGADLASQVSVQTTSLWEGGEGAWVEGSTQPLKYHVVAYDFGIKHSMLRILYDKGCYVTLVPANTTAQAVMELEPDGVFLSNGPGDPLACDYAIEATKQFLKMNIPVFGICLGFQILALALGAKSLKMKFGHHGANHPVIALDEDKKVYITSQNHGFAIDESSLPEELEVTHLSLFDGSLQGIRHKHYPAFGFQGHPEASPGPREMRVLFDRFISIMEKGV